MYCSQRAIGVLFAAACVPVVTVSAALAQPAGLTYPRPGTVCDWAGRTCYDSYGPSVAITAELFGQKAANRLMRNLSQSNSRDFRLSSGQACSVARRLCWDDGWNQSKVAQGLTRQLFGGDMGPGYRPGEPQVTRDRGLCRLNRKAQLVFDGPCQLKQVMQGGVNRYEVRLENGNRFVFMQQSGRYIIRDGFGGSWPVTFVDRGNTGIFRFGDYKLVATQQNSTRGSTSREAAVGNALGNLLNSLFQ